MSLLEGTVTASVRVAECVSEPDSPLTLTLALAAAAEAFAVKVMDCGVPGVRDRVDGLAVTPAGRLVSEMLIVPENPLSAVAETEVGSPAAPDCRLRLFGLRAREKSGGGGGAVTVRASGVVCCSASEFPVNVTVAVPIAAPADADRAMDCGVPGVRFRVAGLAVTPAGRLVREMLTAP